MLNVPYVRAVRITDFGLKAILVVLRCKFLSRKRQGIEIRLSSVYNHICKLYNVASDNYDHLTITEWDWAWYEELYKTRRVLSNEALKALASNSLLEATSKSWHFWWSLTVGSTVCPLKTNWPRNRKNGERTGPDLFSNFKPCETGYESVYYGINNTKRTK